MRPHLLFVIGPTASGKSELAIKIAQSSPMEPKPEIINCDSVQFFAGVDIGAAKPTAEERLLAQHHLTGHVALGAEYTAGDFRRDALRLIGDRHAAGQSRFLPVGGSGFYVLALEKGMYNVPAIPEEVRAQLLTESTEPHGMQKLYDELKARDALAASKIKPQDRYRILRALEILRAHHGKTLTEIRTEFESQLPVAPFKVSKFGVFRERDVLRKRVEARTLAMLEAGLIEEVEDLRTKVARDWSPLVSVGYREVQAYLDGKLPKNELKDAIVTSTMQLAKRQMTWFKRDPMIRWFNAENGWREALDLARTLLD